MTAADYPVTFPFGATSAPYTTASPHRGDDRPCPAGTLIVIGGKQIGLTGATGKVTGPHLHIQEYLGYPANVRKPQNAFKPGRVTVVSESSDFGKYITIQNADGWVDSYCHLSRQDVSVGQIIGGNDMTVDDAGARALLTLSTLMALPGLAADRQPTMQEVQNLIGRDLVDAVNSLTSTAPWGANWNMVKHYDEDVAHAGSGNYEPVTEQLFRKKS